MEMDERLEWLMPNRIMKTIRDFKSPVGGSRLFIIGIGMNGVDIALRCKDFAENFCDFDSHTIRFLGIDLAENLKSAEYKGSRLLDSERIELDPEEAIYPYLNDPERLPKQVREWFDEGLFNYTQKTPVYGKNKRQCARLCVFHYIDKIKNEFERASADFSKGKIPLEIMLVGNLGDSFFGGMAVDLAYIARSVFGSVSYSARICAHMLAADAAPLQGLSGRDLAAFYANTVVTKSELDSFQCKRRRFTQVYSPKAALQCDSSPFSICSLYAAESTYDLTADKVAVRIMSDFSVPYTQDDDVDKKLTNNMLNHGEKRKFNYITGESIFNVVPIAKILCYLSLKTLAKFDEYLCKNTVDEMELGLLKGKVCPDALMLASKAGDVPRFEFDETMNPLFSFESLKRGSNASMKYVTDRLETIQSLCESASEAYSRELYDHVVKVCENAVLDIKKGPKYAGEIVKGCLSALRERTERIRRMFGEIDERVSQAEKSLKALHRKMKAPGFIAKKAVEPYIDRLKEFTELKKSQLTGWILVTFYDKLSLLLDEYMNEKLYKMTNIFNSARGLLDSGSILKIHPQNGFVHEIFDPSSEKTRAALDRIADNLSADKEFVFFKRMNLQTLYRGDSASLAGEIAEMAGVCFGELFTKGIVRFNDEFGAGKTIENVLSDCVNEILITTPTDSEQTVTRIVLPKECESCDYRESTDDETFINVSTMRNAAFVTRIKGGVRLDKFRDYEQWENMRYAYVNDSLKRQGIHIFK